MTTKYTAPWMNSLFVQLPLAGTRGWVKVLPVNDDVGRHYLPHHAYIHDAQLPIQIPLMTTHLAYAPTRAPELEIAPISRWWAVGSAAAIRSTGITNHVAIMAADNGQALVTWDDPATLVELDPDPDTRLTWKTGYDHNGEWRRLDCGFPLDDVISAIQSDLTLKDLAQTR